MRESSKLSTPIGPVAKSWALNSMSQQIHYLGLPLRSLFSELGRPRLQPQRQFLCNLSLAGSLASLNNNRTLCPVMCNLLKRCTHKLWTRCQVGQLTKSFTLQVPSNMYTLHYIRDALCIQLRQHLHRHGRVQIALLLSRLTWHPRT